MDVGEPGLTDPSRLAAGDPHACLLAITEGDHLSAEAARALFARIMDGTVPPIVIAGLLTALRTKGETPDEIAGAARVMRERVTRVPTTRRPLVDTCGTGGDGSGTFNISTTAAFVAAAADVAVAKHGNRAASSRCGSADVLEAAGVAIDLPAPAVGRLVDRVGIGFLFAPRFHAAMRHAIEARRAVGIRTVFNLLGPLTNPAGASRQVIGVPSAADVATIGRVLADLGAEHALVVHGLEGLDEISVTGPTRFAEVRGGEVELGEIRAAQLGLDRFPSAALAGGSRADNERILRAVLEGRGAPAQAAVVAANAGAAIHVAGAAPTLRDAVARAVGLLEAGAGAEVLERLAAESRLEAEGRGRAEDAPARPRSGPSG